MSDRERLANQFRTDLVAGERKAVDAIGRSYRRVLANIDVELRRITEEIEAAMRAGQPASTSLIYQERRLERIRNQALEQLARAGVQAADLIEDARLEAMRQGQAFAEDMVKASFSTGPVPIAQTSFASLPAGSVAEIVAATQPGTQLTTLLGSLAKNASDTIGDTLLNGVALGQNPRKVAAEMRRQMTEPLWRAERIARTEIIRAHRESSRAIYKENSDLVRGWTWYAQTGSCCVACLAMHGTVHSLDERLDGHPNCRCLMLPKVATWAELGYDGIDDEPPVPTGASIAAGMSEKELRERFGPGVASALSRGELTIDQLVERELDPEWGSMRRRRSLRRALSIR